MSELTDATATRTGAAKPIVLVDNNPFGELKKQDLKKIEELGFDIKFTQKRPAKGNEEFFDQLNPLLNIAARVRGRRDMITEATYEDEIRPDTYSNVVAVVGDPAAKFVDEVRKTSSGLRFFEFEQKEELLNYLTSIAPPKVDKGLAG